VNLNGGIDIDFDESEYPIELEMEDLENVWKEKLENDPELLLLFKEQNLAEQDLRISRGMSLPKLTAGYNYQGIEGSNYHGLYGGISIPLWSNQHRVQASRMQLKYSTVNRESKTARYYLEFKQQYVDYELELNKYREYRSTLDALNTEEMWKEIYESGDMTYVVYYMELHFYREAFDEMLEMELNLYQTLADLFRHRL
jgi:outer membrane protein TolC